MPRFDRQAIGADRLGDEAVEPGDIVSIWPWLLHRHARLWDDPDAFDTDRFAPTKDGRHRFQYLPFGAGPRTCVGARIRHGRGADHPRPLAQRMAVRRRRRAVR